jgi:hypothetical protein
MEALRKSEPAVMGCRLTVNIHTGTTGSSSPGVIGGDGPGGLIHSRQPGNASTCVREILSQNVLQAIGQINGLLTVCIELVFAISGSGSGRTISARVTERFK